MQNLKYDAYLVYTNKQPGTAFRGFGNTQIQFAVESHFDDIALRLGIDPVKFRLVNANLPYGETSSGAMIKSLGMVECIERAAAAAEWDKKWSIQKKSGTKRRGMGAAVILHTGAGTRYYGYSSSTASIKISEEGKVSLITSATDMGQGAETVMAQIAAEALGVRVEDVNVVTRDTNYTSYDLGAFGSRTTVICGNSVKAAAEKAKEEVLSFAGEMLEVKKEDLSLVNGYIEPKDRSVKLSQVLSFQEVIKYGIYQKGRSIDVSGEYFDPIGPQVSLGKGYGLQIPSFVVACYVVELEVDTETGEVEVLDVWAANDSGRIINRNTAEGQVEGGIIQGIGMALTEKLMLNHGKVENDSFVDYKVLGAKDIPRIHCLFVETEEPDTPFGAKGIGEHPLIAVIPAIGNAIYNAIGVRLRDLPFTPDKIISALKG